MGTLGDLSKSMANLSVRVEKGGPAIQRKVALEILRLVIYATPVGNKDIWLVPGKARVGYVGGRARANWFVGLGAAPSTVTEEVDESGSNTLGNGTTTIAASLPGQDIHLVNNLPYIVPLNQGHSHQAPEGFVERSILAGLELLKTLKVSEAAK